MWRCSQDQDAGRGDEGRLVCLGLVSVRSDRSGHIYMLHPQPGHNPRHPAISTVDSLRGYKDKLYWRQ